ncbi:low molecular weight protein-tyrosine-phosphatase [Sporolactobacillus vineae]|uniref:low molecular weight protein-tyrosine-phosphatase n=1 Tax=Sporolactobacillus vineae TaxID=444463 RepID=UPI000289A356|nr:low molecular weight protein-tyrosine-phosphatase [Sporolactobacillus vineae]
MIRILFVCLGNICRSPMAEAVLRRKVVQSGAADRIEVDSAGTGGWHIGSLPHPGTRKVLDKAGVSWTGIHARRVTRQDFDHFDLLVAMDRENEADLLALAGPDERRRQKVRRFMEFLDDRKGRDVPDPYYSGNFDRVYRLIDEGTDRLLRLVLKNRIS